MQTALLPVPMQTTLQPASPRRRTTIGADAPTAGIDAPANPMSTTTNAQAQPAASTRSTPMNASSRYRLKDHNGLPHCDDQCHRRRNHGTANTNATTGIAAARAVGASSGGEARGARHDPFSGGFAGGRPAPELPAAAEGRRCRQPPPLGSQRARGCRITKIT